MWAGQAESDGFNALVLRAGLTWRQAMILRAYAKYLRQGGSTFSQTYIEECLTSNVHLARLLVRLFEARFDPEHQDSSADLVEVLLEEIGAALDAVESLDQDRILRSFLGGITATLRTSYFQVDTDGRPKPYVAFKLDPQKVPDLPQPRPRYEIWVYSPRVEGVHLRFGAVARGGLRWSDRREDFRTEVLGLVKAQMVKNAVIVPVGAKGGFVVKHPPADPGNREAVLAEGIACYRTFISGLLDVTDNLVTVDGRTEVVPPPRVVRHDGDDTYLVVAADKGTATFSDIANQVAVDYDFWLGDAFASGGSVGYDHKAMGITARGAWESVKRHFLEMGIDTQSEDFTVVGVGDMSGDVFGNGMLLSEHIRLVAAFDHRHVFLDPDPDPAASYAERRRLFDLPRSSWGDYDSTLLSPGGGIYPRSAKSIPVSAQVRARLGLPSAPRPSRRRSCCVRSSPRRSTCSGTAGSAPTSRRRPRRTPTSVTRPTTRSASTGRRSGRKVVGEGGNLGLTQLGRIEYSQRGADGAGGRVNTDAIDNSAGVDTSDHEVNIKILLDQAVRDGILDGSARNALLADMTDEVARLVLSHNYEQNVLLGIARLQAPAMLSVHERYLKMLEQRGEIDRALEFLPARDVIEQREAAGQGLTSSELAVLEAYAKITLTTTVLDSGLPDDPWLDRRAPPLLPAAGRGRDARPAGGSPAAARDRHELAGQRPGQPGGAHVRLPRPGGDRREPAGDRARLLGRARGVRPRRLLARGRPRSTTRCRPRSRRCSTWRTAGSSTAARGGSCRPGARASTCCGEIEHFRAEVERLLPMVPDLLVGSEHERLLMRQEEFAGLGVPRDLATRGATLLDSFSLLDVVEIAAAEKLPAEEVAAVYFVMSERMEVDKMLTRITGLPRDDRWTALARSALRYDLYAALAGLTSNVLTATSSQDGPVERITAWEEANREGVTRAQATLTEIIESDIYDLATMSVALRTIRTLLRG